MQIGQTGAMVLRMRMPHGADAEPCRLQRRSRRDGKSVRGLLLRTFDIHTYTVPGSHQTPPGDPACADYKAYTGRYWRKMKGIQRDFEAAKNDPPHTQYKWLQRVLQAELLWNQKYSDTLLKVVVA